MTNYCKLCYVKLKLLNINSHPQTTETLSDPLSPLPLSPSTPLTGKTKLTLPPPGKFHWEDTCCNYRWRHVEHTANEFWNRWSKEYLQILQLRQKGHTREETSRKMTLFYWRTTILAGINGLRIKCLPHIVIMKAKSDRWPFKLELDQYWIDQSINLCYC